MTCSTPTGFSVLRFSPERRAFLAGHCLVAEAFRALELPEEEPDFTRVGTYLTLAAAVAEEAPVVFTIAARPAFEDGSVARWLGQLCVREGYEHGRVLTCRIAGLQGVTCDVFQHTGGSSVRGQLVLLEDGGRLFKLAALAPEALWERYAARFGVMLQSFDVDDVRGAKCPLTAAQQRTLTPPVRPVLLTREEWDELVLADDTASLDPLRELPGDIEARPRATVPGVITVDAAAHLAVVASPSLEGTIRLPFGWRVVDDGARTIVFDPAAEIRIVLEELAHSGRTLHQLAEDFAEGSFTVRRLRASTSLLFDDIVGVEVQGNPDDEPRCDRAFLLRDVGRPGCVLVASVRADRREIRPARNLAGEILASFESIHAAAAS